MKKRTKIIAASLSALIVISGMGIGASVPISGVTKANYQFVINEEKLDLPPYLTVMSKDNATYVPIRFLSENMGLKVEYLPGTVKISSDEFKAISTDQTKNKIADLENQVKQLKAENEMLKKQVLVNEANTIYNELPAYADSGTGLRIKLKQITKTDKGLNLSVEFINSSLDRYFIVDPVKTKLLLDGKPYDAYSQDTDVALNSSLRSAPDKYSPITMSGNIAIEGATNDKVKGSVLFSYYDDEGEWKSMQLAFDNTK